MAARSRPLAAVALATLVAVAGGSGCAPLTTGAYADEERRTVGEVTDDINITSAVKARLIRDGEVRARNIEVETRRGVVTLYGHVAHAQLEQRAVELAGGIPGVVTVQSRLVVLDPEQ